MLEWIFGRTKDQCFLCYHPIKDNMFGILRYKHSGDKLEEAKVCDKCASEIEAPEFEEEIENDSV